MTDTTDTTITNRFSICLPYILQEEGGNDDNPHDPGGRTSRGITQNEYNAYRESKNESVADVWIATDVEVADIYQTSYWQPWCPKMLAGVDLCFFNMCVNSGPVEAVKLLQRALNVPSDGHIGLITLAALNTANSIKLISNFSDQCRTFYQSLRTYKYFGKGWMARVSTIEEIALKMAVN